MRAGQIFRTARSCFQLHFSRRQKRFHFSYGESTGYFFDHCSELVERQTKNGSSMAFIEAGEGGIMESAKRRL
jgi:hypothetical protein